MRTSIVYSICGANIKLDKTYWHPWVSAHFNFVMMCTRVKGAVYKDVFQEIIKWPDITRQWHSCWLWQPLLSAGNTTLCEGILNVITMPGMVTHLQLLQTNVVCFFFKIRGLQKRKPCFNRTGLSWVRFLQKWSTSVGLNSVYFLHGCCLHYQWGDVVREGGQGWNGLLGFITSCWERDRLVQRHKSIRLWGNYTEGTKVKEKGRQEWACWISLSDSSKPRNSWGNQWHFSQKLKEFSTEMEAKVHKTQFSFHISGIFPFLFFIFPATSLHRLKQLSDSSTALRCTIYFPAFELLLTMKHFMKRFRRRFTFSSPKRIFTTHSHMSASHSLPPHADFPISVWKQIPRVRTSPAIMPTTCSAVDVGLDSPQPISANVLFSEQIQAFTLVLTECAINNSQQMWSNPTKTVEWTISSKHGRGLLGVSDCWCIPAELVSWPMNQTLLLTYGYPDSAARLSHLSCFLFDNIQTNVFK